MPVTYTVSYLPVGAEPGVEPCVVECGEETSVVLEAGVKPLVPYIIRVASVDGRVGAGLGMAGVIVRVPAHVYVDSTAEAEEGIVVNMTPGASGGAEPAVRYRSQAEPAAAMYGGAEPAIQYRLQWRDVMVTGEPLCSIGYAEPAEIVAAELPIVVREVKKDRARLIGVRVRAEGLRGMSEWSAVSYITVLPDVSGVAVAVGPGSGEVTITWERVDGATAYDISCGTERCVRMDVLMGVPVEKMPRTYTYVLRGLPVGETVNVGVSAVCGEMASRTAWREVHVYEKPAELRGVRIAAVTATAGIYRISWVTDTETDAHAVVEVAVNDDVIECCGTSSVDVKLALGQRHVVSVRARNGPLVSDAVVLRVTGGVLPQMEGVRLEGHMLSWGNEAEGLIGVRVRVKDLEKILPSVRAVSAEWTVTAGAGSWELPEEVVPARCEIWVAGVNEMGVGEEVLVGVAV